MMSRKRRRIVEKHGAVPGTLTHIGTLYEERTRIQVIQYDPEHCQLHADFDAGFASSASTRSRVTWVQVNGLSEVDKVAAVGQAYNIHPLVMEDLLNATQRAKYEEHPDYLFIVIKVPFLDQDEIHFEQVSLLVGETWVISLMETNRELLLPIQERIRDGKGRIRSLGADYCAYALLDVMIDSYFTIMEQIGDRIEQIEETLLQKPAPQLLQQIHRMKRSLLFLHKASWPLRELTRSLQQCPEKFCSVELLPFLRDLHDHVFQIVDTVEIYRDIVSGMLDTYLSSVSYRLNDIMKVLTVISTIFIPLTFLAGVYGMNFDYIPELHWPYGYFILWGIMLMIAATMLILFYRAGWIGFKRILPKRDEL